MRAAGLLLFVACSAATAQPSGAACEEPGDLQLLGSCGFEWQSGLIEQCSAGEWSPLRCDVYEFITPSAALCDVTPLRTKPDPTTSVTVTTASGSWAAVLAQVTPAVLDIVVMPGDYRAWGSLDIATLSGTPARPRTIRYGGPGAQWAPVDRRDAATEALIHGIFFSGAVHDWIVSGLTIRAPANTAGGIFHVLAGSRITFDRVLVEDTPQQFGVRIRDGDGVCVQRSVIRRATSVNNDNVGIAIKPNATAVTGVRIVQNEVYDWIDAVQITQQNGELAYLPTDYVIEDNDLYTTSAKHVADPGTGDVYGCTENAIDVKMGSPTVRSVIRRNRMWGYRETPPMAQWSLCGEGFSSGSAGDAIVVHIGGENVDIDRNVIGDAVHGVRESYRLGGRSLNITRNFFYSIPAPGAANTRYDGAVLVLEGAGTVTGNRFAATAPRLCPPPEPSSYAPLGWPPSGWGGSAPEVSGNGHVGILPMAGGACGWDGAESAVAHDLRYVRRLHTAPEFVTVSGGVR